MVGGGNDGVPLCAMVVMCVMGLCVVRHRRIEMAQWIMRPFVIGGGVRTKLGEQHHLQAVAIIHPPYSPPMR